MARKIEGGRDTGALTVAAPRLVFVLPRALTSVGKSHMSKRSYGRCSDADAAPEGCPSG
jgi:hypothetical protein